MLNPALTYDDSKCVFVKTKIKKQVDLDINNKQIKPQNNYMVLEATAYTRSAEEETSRGITRCGTLVSRGTVAVDPRVIPLGTRLYVEGYGHAVALDTGGDIKHDRIDLYMETKREAFEFGRQNVKVWIIEE